MPYVYKPLPSQGRWIRTLTLHPGAPSDTITISLQQESLATPRDYEALSYVWGSTEHPASVVVEPGCDFSITQSLHAALKQLRYENESRVLWVDAICINQWDLEERDRQVSQMDAVYEQADSVLVWLGAEAEESGLAIRQLDDIGQAVQVVFDRSFVVRPRDNESAWARMLADRNAALSLPDPILKALHALLGRPWFERLWVRQEVHPANRRFEDAVWAHEISPEAQRGVGSLTEPNKGRAIIHCGAASMSWWNFHNAINCLVLKNLPRPDMASSPLEDELGTRLVAVEMLTRHSNFDWPTLSSYIRGTKCSDLRDRVYAVMNLVGSKEKSLVIIPDYTKTATEVFRDLALKYIEHFGTLNILCECYSDRLAKIDQPSWIPNWAGENAVALELTASLQWLASGHLVTSPTFSSATHLEVAAVLIDTIHTRWFPFSRLMGSSEPGFCVEFWKTLSSTLLGGEDPQSPYPAGGTKLEALLRTITMNRLADGHDPRFHFEADPQPSRVFLQSLLSGMPLNEIADTGVDEIRITADAAAKFRAAVMQGGVNYGVCISAKKYFAMVPSWARGGDMIAVIVGAQLPFVLRPSSAVHDKPKAFRIVAPCYIHGFMNGEALLGPLPRGVDTVVDMKTALAKFRDPAHGMQLEDPRLAAIFTSERLQVYQESIRSGVRRPMLRLGKDDFWIDHPCGGGRWWSCCRRSGGEFAR